MLGIIKRTKSAPIDHDRPECGNLVRVHYAGRVDAAGSVTMWVEDKKAAVAVEKSAAESVIARNGNRLNAGNLEFVKSK